MFIDATKGFAGLSVGMARDLIVGRYVSCVVRNSYWLEYVKVGRKPSFQSRIGTFYFSSPQNTHPPNIESRAILCMDT